MNEPPASSTMPVTVMVVLDAIRVPVLEVAKRAPGVCVGCVQTAATCSVTVPLLSPPVAIVREGEGRGTGGRPDRLRRDGHRPGAVGLCAGQQFSGREEATAGDLSDGSDSVALGAANAASQPRAERITSIPASLRGEYQCRAGSAGSFPPGPVFMAVPSLTASEFCCQGTRNAVGWQDARNPTPGI